MPICIEYVFFFLLPIHVERFREGLLNYGVKKVSQSQEKVACSSVKFDWRPILFKRHTVRTCMSTFYNGITFFFFGPTHNLIYDNHANYEKERENTTLFISIAVGSLTSEHTHKA